MTESNYSLTIALNVLNLLGPNLYSNIPAVLSELIANAWDADATLVSIDIDIENDRIIICDNGMGMAIADMNSKYLRVGYQKRAGRKNDLTSKGRQYMGRKGIGKLAVFSFAQQMEIQSCKNGEKAGCIMYWDKIAEEIGKNNYEYRPVPIPNDEITIEQGTQIILTQLSEEKLLPAMPTLRSSLARRFTVLDGKYDFEIRFGGKALSDQDRPFYDNIEFIWYLGSESKGYVDKCPKVLKSNRVDADIEVNNEVHRVSGWVGTVGKPSDVKEGQNNSIALYAHGKLIQEDILADFQESQAYAEYLVGDINVDFMDSDDEDDIITADRQRVNQNDPRYQAIKKYVKDKILKEIASNWDLWRLERGAGTALQIPQISRWYETLNKTNRRKAARLFDKINGLANVDDQTKSKLYEICVEAFEQLKETRGIPTMEDQVFVDLVLSRKPTQYEATTSSYDPESTSQNPQNSTPTGQQNSEDEQTSVDATTSDPADSSTPSETNNRSEENETEQGDSESSYRRSSSPSRESDELFKSIRALIRNSLIEAEFKKVALNDLNEAQKVYRSEGYKACVVMLGAVLEAIMLGVLRQPAVVNEFRSSPQKYSRKIGVKGGLGHSDYTDDKVLANAIADQLTFDNYRQVIEELIPGIESLKIEGLQQFRNAIHPWKVICEPQIYGSYSFERSMNHLVALSILANYILNWKPTTGVQS